MAEPEDDLADFEALSAAQAEAAPPEDDLADFEALSADAGAGDDLADFEAVSADKTPANGQTAAQKPSAPRERGTGSSWTDALLGFGEGVSLGHGDDLASAGAWLGDTAYNALRPQPAATKTGRTATDMGAELSERAGETGAGAAGQIGGSLLAGGIMSAAAPATVAGQAVGGALLGEAQAQGKHGWDPLAMLAGGVEGGAMGAGGALIGKGIQQGARALSAPAKKAGLWSDLTLHPDELTSPVWQGVRESADTVGDELLKKLAIKPEMAIKPWELPGALAAQGAVRGLQAAAPHADKIAKGVRAVAQGAGAVGARPTSWLASKAGAQDVAYAGTDTTNWAVQSVLSSGQSGLPPQDEQQLTEAVMSGDADKIASTNFVLAQRHPEYAKRMQDEYRSLQNSE